MIINQIQVERKREEIVQNNLKCGVIPTSFEVGAAANEYFENKTPGLPFYRPTKQVSHGLSNAESYNQMFSNLKEDLEVCYQANVQNTYKSTELEENYLIEKDKVQSKIKALKLRLESISETLKEGESAYNYSKTFDNFYDIEFNGDAERNIPKTTGFVDLNQKCLTLDRMSLSIDKCDLSKSDLSIQILGSYEKVERLGEERHILNDTVNQSYAVITTSANNKEMGLQLELSSNEPIMCNNFKLQVLSQQILQGRLEVYDEDGTKELLHAASHHDLFEWSFESRRVSKFIVQLTKDEPDGINDDGLYEYSFILKNIAVSQESYSGKGIFVSNQIELGAVTKSLELKVNELVYNDTDISYFIGFDNGTDPISWERVTPGVPHDNGFVIKKTDHIDSSNFYYDDHASAADGIGLQGNAVIVPIHLLPSNCLKDTIEIIPATNSWFVQVLSYGYSVNIDYSRPVIDLDKLDLEEFLSTFKRIEKGWAIIPNARTVDSETNCLLTMTQFIELEEETYIKNQKIYSNEDCRMTTSNEEEIQPLASQSEFQTRLFVNGVEVKSLNMQGDDEAYSFKLLKGRNKVQILCLVDEPRNSSNGNTIYMDFDFSHLTSKVYGIQPLKQVEFHQLVSQSSQTGEECFDYFSVQDNCIYVNHDFYSYDDDEHLSSGIYRITYHQVKPEYERFFKKVNGERQMTVRLMAVLESQNRSFSPKILDYRLVAK